MADNNCRHFDLNFERFRPNWTFRLIALHSKAVSFQQPLQLSTSLTKHPKYNKQTIFLPSHFLDFPNFTLPPPLFWECKSILFNFFFYRLVSSFRFVSVFFFLLLYIIFFLLDSSTWKLKNKKQKNKRTVIFTTDKQKSWKIVHTKQTLSNNDNLSRNDTFKKKIYLDHVSFNCKLIIFFLSNLFFVVWFFVEFTFFCCVL